MTTTALGTVLHNLRRSLLHNDEAGLTDSELLEGFLTRRDEGAFAALVRRHGPMVLGVCRRVLRNEADAEDAFQATFLVLVRKATSIRPRSMVGNWLYGVAHSTALKARAMSTKRLTKEREAAARPKPDAAAEAWNELHALLDQELKVLPDIYRVAIVFCDLEGKSIKEAARQLGCPHGTVITRLARGRRLLARRLARHGLTLSGGVIGTMIAQTAAKAGVPPLLMSSTIKAATLIAAGQAAASGVISAKVAALTEGVVKTMFLTKLKVATAGLLVASLLVGGALLSGLSALPQSSLAQQPAVKQQEKPPEQGDGKKKPADAKGVLVAAVRAARDIKADNDEARRRKVDFLVLLAHRQEKASDRAGAATTFKEALTVADTIEGSEQRADAQSHVGFYQAHAGFVREAADTAKGIAIKAGKLKGDALKHRVDGLKGHVLAELAAHLASTAKFDEALATADTIAVRVRRFKAKDKDKIVEQRDTVQRDLAYQHIAKAQLKAGKTEEAFKTLAKIDEWRSEVFLYQDILIAHGKGKDLATVRKLVAAFKKEMEKREVSAATRHHILADVQGALGDAAGAIEWIERLDSPQAKAEALMGLSIGLSRAEAKK